MAFVMVAFPEAPREFRANSGPLAIHSLQVGRLKPVFDRVCDFVGALGIHQEGWRVLDHDALIAQVFGLERADLGIAGFVVGVTPQG